MTDDAFQTIFWNHSDRRSDEPDRGSAAAVTGTGGAGTLSPPLNGCVDKRLKFDHCVTRGRHLPPAHRRTADLLMQFTEKVSCIAWLVFTVRQ